MWKKRLVLTKDNVCSKKAIEEWQLETLEQKQFIDHQL